MNGIDDVMKLVSLPLVEIEHYDHVEQKMVRKIGYIETCGHFVYVRERLYANGGAGAELFSVSADNIHSEKLLRWDSLDIPSRVTYDELVDMYYVGFIDGTSIRTVKTDAYIDFGPNDEILGIEIEGMG
jgi:hypothetical protein